MKPPHTRPTCRAHNRFSASIVLWQHFVGARRPFLHHRHGLASAASEPTPDGTPQAPKPTIRRLPFRRGTWYPTKVEASVRKNVQSKVESSAESLTESDKLLAVARAAFSQGEEYAGVIFQPIKSPTPYRESGLPWCLEPNERTMPGIDRLAEEIKRFYKYYKPNQMEAFARSDVIDRVRDLVEHALPHHVLEVFGSERTGLAGPTSDIDFRLLPKNRLDHAEKTKLPPTPEQRSAALRNLHRVRLLASKRKDYDLVELRYARYPLISLQDRQSGLDVQIVSSNDTAVSREIMKGYMEQYTYLRELYFVVKTIFDVRGLSDVFKGGFGSYSLFMMIVASIRLSPHPRNDAAGSLVNFLKFYRDLDTSRHGISMEPIMLFDKESNPVLTDKAKAKIEAGSAKPLPPYMLCLRDPADETNDLGRKGIAIKHVKTTFKKISFDLDRQISMNTRASLLGPLVGEWYTLNKARRQKLSEYGSNRSTQLRANLAVTARAVREREGLRENEDREALEELEQARLRSEARDEEWQRLSEERSKKLQAEVARAALLDHGDAMASILDMPSVDHEAQTEEASESRAQPATDIPSHDEVISEADRRSVDSAAGGHEMHSPKASG